MIDLSVSGNVADNPAAGLALEVVSFENPLPCRLPVFAPVAPLVEVRPTLTSARLAGAKV